MKRLRSLVSVGRTTHRGASSMIMVVGSISSLLSLVSRSLKAVFPSAPGMCTWNERRLDTRFFDIRDALVECALVHQGAAFSGDRHIAGDRIGLAKIAAAGIER